ncbi:MAG: 4'-phosphopantetheinyl transferase, partial [Acidobacteria bacterium]
GVPYLKVTGTAEKALQHLKVDRLHLSLSHTQEHAIAIVILERI